MIFQKSQPAEAGTEFLFSASTGPLNIRMHHSRTKSARSRNARESWYYFEHFRTAMARAGRYEDEALHKSRYGALSLLYKSCYTTGGGGVRRVYVQPFRSDL
jgi:hypothetical protein